MRVVVAVLFVGLLAAPAGAAGRRDRDGQDPFAGEAPAVLRRAVEAAQRLPGATIHYSAAGLGFGCTWTVRCLEDVAVFEGEPKIYAKGDRMLVEREGGLERPEEVPETEGIRSCLAIHPHTILEQVNRVRSAAAWAGEEELEGRACRVVVVEAGPRLALAQIASMLARTAAYRARANDLVRRLIPDQTQATYRLWLDAQTGEIVKLQWEVVPGVPEVGPEATAGEMGAGGEEHPASPEGQLLNLQLNYELTWQPTGELLELDLPEEVRRALQIRQRPRRER